MRRLICRFVGLQSSAFVFWEVLLRSACFLKTPVLAMDAGQGDDDGDYVGPTQFWGGDFDPPPSIDMGASFLDYPPLSQEIAPTMPFRAESPSIPVSQEIFLTMPFRAALACERLTQLKFVTSPPGVCTSL